MTQVIAQAKNVRVSPHKVRLVAAQIKKLEPQDAIKILDFVPKVASLPLKKVIASALANARNNYNVQQNNLKFAEIQVGKGQVFKRFRPVSRGRAHSILRRTSNIKIVLEGQEIQKDQSKSDQKKEDINENSK